MTSLGTTSVPPIPDSRIARDSTAVICSVESDLLCHRPLRVYSWGALQDALRGLRYNPELLSYSAATAPKRERSRVAIRRSRTVFDAPLA